MDKVNKIIKVFLSYYGSIAWIVSISLNHLFQENAKYKNVYVKKIYSKTFKIKRKDYFSNSETLNLLNIFSI